LVKPANHTDTGSAMAGSAIRINRTSFRPHSRQPKTSNLKLHMLHVELRQRQ
jgi:hypothetical protein